MPARGPRKIEKRTFIRLPTSARIQFRAVGQVISHRRLSKDLSISGVRFLSDELLPVSSNIKVSLHIREDEMPVEFICQVAWLKSLYNDECYEIGAKILQISRENQERLNEYIATPPAAETSQGDESQEIEE